MILIYSLFLSLCPSVDVISVSAPLNEFSVFFSVCEAGFIEALMIQSSHHFCVCMSSLGMVSGLHQNALLFLSIAINLFSTAINQSSLMLKWDFKFPSVNISNYLCATSSNAVGTTTATGLMG